MVSPKVRAASNHHHGGRPTCALTPDRCSTASSCAANGTDCRKSLGTTAPSIAPLRWVERVLRRLGGRMRRVGRCGLGMASGRRSHGQGTFGGDLIPTDRGKAGSKRSLLVDGDGGPLSIVVVELTSMSSRPYCGRTTAAHRGGTPVSGLTILQAVELPPDTAITIRRIGEEKPSARPVGCGTDAGMALQVPCGLGSHDKKASNYLGVLQLACALLWFRRQWRLANLR